MKEGNIQALIMMRASKLGCIVWRNNTGTLPDSRGIPVRFGLCVGSSDLIGIAPDGKFLAIEVKTEKGKVTPKQRLFIDAVRARCGYAGVARCEDDVERILKGENLDV